MAKSAFNLRQSGSRICIQKRDTILFFKMNGFCWTPGQLFEVLRDLSSDLNFVADSMGVRGYCLESSMNARHAPLIQFIF